jgi:hypothetical protein
VAKAEAGTRRGPSIATVSARRRRTGARRLTKKVSVIRRVARVVWGLPRHAALALAVGLVCGGLAARIGGGMISPPYAAILGTLVVYPALVTVWRLVPRPGRRRR